MNTVRTYESTVRTTLFQQHFNQMLIQSSIIAWIFDIDFSLLFIVEFNQKNVNKTSILLLLDQFLLLHSYFIYVLAWKTTCFCREEKILTS